MATSGLGRPTAVDAILVAEGIFRASGWGGAFAGSRRFPRHPVIPYGFPGSPWVDALGHAKAPWRQAQVCLRPLSSFGEDRASRPPPLQHRVSHTSRGRARFLEGFRRRRPDPDRSGTFSVTGGADLGSGTRPGLYAAPVRPHGFLDIRMGHSTNVLRCRSAAANCGYSQPLSHSGLLRAPWAPTSCPRLPHPVVPSRHWEELSLAQAWWGFPRLSPIPVPSLSSSRIPKL